MLLPGTEDAVEQVHGPDRDAQLRHARAKRQRAPRPQQQRHPVREVAGHLPEQGRRRGGRRQDVRAELPQKGTGFGLGEAGDACGRDWNGVGHAAFRFCQNGYDLRIEELGDGGKGARERDHRCGWEMWRGLCFVFPTACGMCVGGPRRFGGDRGCIREPG